MLLVMHAWCWVWGKRTRRKRIHVTQMISDLVLRVFWFLGGIPNGISRQMLYMRPVLVETQQDRIAPTTDK